MSEIKDDNMFRYLAPEPMPTFPEGCSGVLELKTSRELMEERDEWIKNSVPCECCKGRGRVPAPTQVGAA
ncbi:hypothetical protein [Afipia felis]|uniref:hypothetical protein n=1 Tax=Afipia felis TaxID=1035 RepID=UPI0011C04040|nr:hypothetical protein [Afipia felis]